MIRLVLDTNVVVSGLVWGGTPRQLLDLSTADQVELFSSGALLDELVDVLTRDKFATMLASQDITPAFLMQRYGLLVNLVTPEKIKRTARDVNDDKVIGTALAAQADVIVSGDKDLLVLHPHKNISILNPNATLRHVVAHLKGKTP